MIRMSLYGVLLLLMTVACNQPEQKAGAAKEKSSQPASRQPPASLKHIVFFGNSLTAGYGLNLSEAFPALIQSKIDSLRLPYKVINAGLSGETTAGGNSRIDWILKQPVDIFVLELGGNDGLRGIPLESTKKNLQEILNKVREKYPNAQILLAGMRVPPNMGKTYSDQFQAVFNSLAKENPIAFLPFLLEGVGGEPRLNQADGIHPTAEGQKIVAENVWTVLKGLLSDKDKVAVSE